MSAVDCMRTQFYNRWKENIVEVTVIRDVDIEADGFFWEDTELDPTKFHNMYLNINGDALGAKKRSEEGLTSDGENIAHAMALYDADIQASDLIDWDGNIYRIENFDTGALYNGQLVFIQFNIVQIREKQKNGN